MENAVAYKVTYIVWRSRFWHLDDPAGTCGTPKPLVLGDPVRDHTTSIHFTSTDDPLLLHRSTPGEGDSGQPAPGRVLRVDVTVWVAQAPGDRRMALPRGAGHGHRRDLTPPIVAVAGGTVTFAGDCGCGYGLLTTISTLAAGWSCTTATSSAISTTVGAVVEAGDPIGRSAPPAP